MACLAGRRCWPTVRAGIQRGMASTTESAVRFYDGASGVTIERSAFLRHVAAFKQGVVLFGENHDDPTAHSLEMDVLAAAHKAHGENMALSLEFYDREAQAVMDEYLAGYVDRETFLRDARPPANHEDYWPLIDFCREQSLAVICANCPRRYSRLVARHGRDKLDECVARCPASAFNLPPLPYGQASDSYAEAFADVMSALGRQTVPSSMLEAQSLWDASMADSIRKVSVK